MENNLQQTVAHADSNLAATLAKIEIPPRPVILDKIMLEMQRDDPDFRRLATLITSDVGMAAALIKTANSPYFGFRNRAGTIRDALTMLGLLNVLRTVSGYSLTKALPESPLFKGFWNRSTRVAYLCGWLVKQLGTRHGIRADDAYTYGLFHDCGIPILLRAFEDYQATYALKGRGPNHSLTLLETERHGISHAMVGCALAKNWLLPEIHAQAILHHHDQDLFTSDALGMPPGVRRLAALGHVAERLDSSTDDAHDLEWERLGPLALDGLEISAAQMEAFASDAQALIKGIEA